MMDVQCFVAVLIPLAFQGGASAAGPDAPRPAERFEPLFNGRDLEGWYTFLQRHGKDSDPDRVITVEDGAIHLYKHAEDGSDVVMGYIATEREYGDYHLRFRYRWGRKKFRPRLELKRDAGVYYHLIGPDAVWPRALQFQVQQGDVGDLLALHGLRLDTTIDPATRDDPIAPAFLEPERGGVPRVLGVAGESGIGYQRRSPGDFEVDGWNTAEIIAEGDTTTHILNGRVVNRGRAIRLEDPESGPAQPISRGRIALEIEAAEVYFRDIELRRLGPTTPDGPERAAARP